MRTAYVIADNIISPLGFTTTDNYNNLLNNLTGIQLRVSQKIYPVPFYCSLIRSDEIESHFDRLDSSGIYTRLEKLIILSIENALQEIKIDVRDDDTLIVISTTKGNIDLIDRRDKNIEKDRLLLWKLAEQIKYYFHSVNDPVVISNACISGVLALIYASRLVQKSVYKNVIVTGGDIISEFVVSGFHSFHSLSEGPCKPFDIDRSGLSLGEGCGTIILSEDRNLSNKKEIISFCGGAVSNDANHISGPSRSGDGLFHAIKNTLEEARSHSVESVDYISAHGTGTLYNDESEALAISIAGLESIPVNSLKGYWGHTLGAAGIIESVAAIQCMRNNMLLGTLGFEKHGVSKLINIIKESYKKEIKSCIKTASGFGGCNAAIAFVKQ
jgi:3-oxoacyl-[acyl-carrier-protein] synthase I